MKTLRQINRKVILMGGFAVGKTSLTNRLVHQRFSNEYEATKGVHTEKYSIQLAEQGYVVQLSLWDMANIFPNELLPESYLQATQGMIWVFDLSRPGSWIGLEHQMEEYRQRLPGIPVLLAGNKLDLVQEERVRAALKEAGIQPDMLCSAKSGAGVETLFREMAMLCIQ